LFGKQKERKLTDPAFADTSGQLLEPTEPRELCALCGRLTSVPMSTPIDLRNYYEPGFGQLCAMCYKEILQNR